MIFTGILHSTKEHNLGACEIRITLNFACHINLYGYEYLDILHMTKHSPEDGWYQISAVDGATRRCEANVDRLLIATRFSTPAIWGSEGESGIEWQQVLVIDKMLLSKFGFISWWVLSGFGWVGMVATMAFLGFWRVCTFCGGIFCQVRSTYLQS